MSNQLKEFARELLEIEQRRVENVALESDQSRRQLLISRIFGQSDSTLNQRRSFRLSADVWARVSVQGRLAECTVTEISMIGLKVSGGIFFGLVKEGIVLLNLVEIKGSRVSVGLRCRIVQIQKNDRNGVAGLEILEDNLRDARSAFLEKIHYPLYLDYLSSLAET